MNRIIIIGNGFDKGIGLPTLYGDFMEWLINDIIKNVNDKIPEDLNDSKIELDIYNKVQCNNYDPDYADNFIICNNIDFQKLDRELFFKRLNNGPLYYVEKSDYKYQLKQRLIENTHYYKRSCNSLIQCNNIILRLLIQEYDLSNTWGNIEQIFYDELIKTTDENIKKLNNDFINFIKKLEEYLRTIDIDSIINSKSNNFINYIKDNIYSDQLKPSHFCPTSIKEKLIDIRNFISNRTFEDRNNIKSKINYEGALYNNDFIDFLTKNDIELTQLSHHFDIENYLFLNFNYTDTHKYFINEEMDNIILNIHGDLTENTNSPIIFGFGDELDKNYKILEDKNNNEFLKHIKSINYLQNNSYRKLIEFLESDQFQIYIFGHSCGTSDRTLLNTIFEHDNCISIIPFVRADKDNYQDIVMNIYRNFTDKRKLRKRVVNKELCEKMTLDEK
ncbi:AbiH family protein [Empedobacter brevis]|uniref:AbiH family protein n=1 Tax=Empedobacter brevis TaxID=247 RepID=UPI0028A2060A|nr:AbiH family protein [Empedobacter brevis]